MIAATDTGLVPMRVSKAVAFNDGDDLSAYVVLDELDGDRHLVIGVGYAEAFALDGSQRRTLAPRTLAPQTSCMASTWGLESLSPGFYGWSSTPAK